MPDLADSVGQLFGDAIGKFLVQTFAEIEKWQHCDGDVGRSSRIRSHPVVGELASKPNNAQNSRDERYDRRLSKRRRKVGVRRQPRLPTPTWLRGPLLAPPECAFDEQLVLLKIAVSDVRTAFWRTTATPVDPWAPGFTFHVAGFPAMDLEATTLRGWTAADGPATAWCQPNRGRSSSEPGAAPLRRRSGFWTVRVALMSACNWRSWPLNSAQKWVPCSIRCRTTCGMR